MKKVLSNKLSQKMDWLYRFVNLFRDSIEEYDEGNILVLRTSIISYVLKNITILIVLVVYYFKIDSLINFDNNLLIFLVYVLPCFAFIGMIKDMKKILNGEKIEFNKSMNKIKINGFYLCKITDIKLLNMDKRFIAESIIAYNLFLESYDGRKIKITDDMGKSEAIRKINSLRSYLEVEVRYPSGLYND